MRPLRKVDPPRSDPSARIRKSSHTRQKAVRSPGPEDEAAPTEVVLDCVFTRADLERKVNELEQEDYFEALRVPFDADARAIEIAYHKQIYLWHPERLPPHLQDAQPLALAICARLGKARRVLLDPLERAAHRRAVGERAARAHEEQRRERAAFAAKLVDRAEIALRRRAFAEAESLLKEAIELAGEQPRYLALMAWAQAEKMGPSSRPRPGRTTQRYDAQLDLLDRAIRNDPNCEQSRHYRAELLKRAGFVEDAVHDFRMAVMLNPRNVDAAREVHAHEMAKLRGKKRSLFGRMISNAEAAPRRRTPSNE